MSRLTALSSKLFSNLVAKEQLYVVLVGDRIILSTHDKLIFDQPAAVLFHQAENKVIAVGDKALALQSSNIAVQNSALQLSYILKHGALTDFDSAEVFFKHLLSNLGSSNCRHYRLVYFHQNLLTPLQKQHLQTLFKKLGFIKIKALSLSAVMAESYKQAVWSLFVGDEISELSLSAKDTVLASYKLSFGLEKVYQSLKQFFLDSLDLTLSKAEITRIMANLNSQRDENLLIQVKGETPKHQILIKTIKLNLVLNHLEKSLAGLLEQIDLCSNLTELKNPNIISAKQECLLFGSKNLAFIKEFLSQKTTLNLKQVFYPDFVLSSLMNYGKTIY